MDARKLFDRTDGRLPFVLLDGHGSRAEHEFIEHANDPKHEWVVCAGVPCGTSLWQLGDSSEQNGSFNVEMTRAKAELADLKMELSLAPKLVPADAMLLTSKAWTKSFARKDTNRKAIAERGWHPCNRVLLKHPDIRATMTPDEKLEELNISIYCSDSNSDISSLTDNLPTINANMLH